MNRNTTPYSRWKFLWYTDTFRIIDKNYKTYMSAHNWINLLPEPNKKIASFYEALNNINNGYTKISHFNLISWQPLPLNAVLDDVEIILNWWSDWMDWRTIRSEWNENIEIEWVDVWDNDRPLIPYEKGNTTITRKEFFLLMQIYFWVYGEEELKKQYEENERQGKYIGVKEILDFKKYESENTERVKIYNDNVIKRNDQTWNYSNKLLDMYNEFIRNNLYLDIVQEYLKLKLMQQDISWAFGWLKIEKIYDKDWDEMRQKEHIDAINKEFWEEVVVME